MPILALSILFFLSSHVYALTLEQLDNGFVQHNESIEESFSREVNDYRLLLSVPKRINNEISIESEQLLKGKLEVQLVNLSPNKPLKNYFSLLESRINEQGEQLFKCVERSCGVSSIWANDIFGERRLSGRDSDQYYIAGKIKLDGSTFWISAYLVTNALRKNLMLISYVKESTITPKWINGYTYDPNENMDPQVQGMLEEKLSRDTSLILYVVVFSNAQEGDSLSSVYKQTEVLLNDARNKLKSALKLGDDRIKGLNSGAFHDLPDNGKGARFKLYLFKL